MTGESMAWVVALVGILVAIAMTVTRPVPVRVRTAVAVLVAVVALLALVFGVDAPAPAPWIATSTAALMCVLAVVGGNPVTATVLRAAMRQDVAAGTHGGIIVVRAGTRPDTPGATHAPGQDRAARQPVEVLRGGTAIGHLERVAIVGAVLLGHFEIVAAVIAIKGLGRFSELDSAEARERFIIGTLTSCIWAALVTFVTTRF